MNARGFALFPTPIGRCGIAWGTGGVLGLQLPEASAAATRARMRTRFPQTAEAVPPRAIARVLRDIMSLLGGKRIDLTSVLLDMNGVSPFHRRAYDAARAIPAGHTRSYGEIATALGSPNSSRAVGQAMRRNPFPILVPCHRVLAAGGRAGGFTAQGGVATKMRMLEIEGASVGAARANVESLRPGRDLAKRAGALPFDARIALRELRSCDPVLARLIDEVGALRLRIKDTASVFGALAEAIVYQQLTGKAAATIHGRLCALFPRTRAGFSPAHILAASDEALRGAGLSRAKVAALRDLAQRSKDGEIPTLARLQKMDDGEIIESLTKVRGIGRWTVEMLLIFRLGRADVLPADDYGVRKGFAATYRKRDLPSAKDLARHGELWKPWRSVASWYLWRAADSPEAAARRRAAAAPKASAPPKPKPKVSLRARRG